jgi:hypothetical protein
VIGGPDAFALAASDPDNLVDVLARKFVTEIALYLDGGYLGGGGHAVR